MPFLTHFFFGWEVFPYGNRLQNKVGTLILTSLLEDLENPVPQLLSPFGWFRGWFSM